MVSTPLSKYNLALEQGLLISDPFQKEAVMLLEHYFQKITMPNKANKVSHEQASVLNHVVSIFKNIFSPQEKVAQKTAHEKLGCYIWGGVGRGKTHLMDYFFESLPAHVRAKRTHFHRFMREVHQRMHELEGTANPLSQIGMEYAQKFDVICLDEFVVIDITDAMLLAGLTDAFFKAGLYLITTSNAHPTDLYKDGLQRARFLPTIGYLQEYLDIYHLDSSNDFRLRHLKQNPVFNIQSNQGAMDSLLNTIFIRHSNGHGPQAGKIDINSRQIAYKAMHNDVVWFDFNVICGNQRSVADYMEIAKEFHTVLVSDIPVLDKSLESEARRFIHLIDELYDARIKLVATAAAPINELYQGTQVEFEFQRTESRLIEMQSDEYLAQPLVKRMA